jgi:hypothetical protein
LNVIYVYCISDKPANAELTGIHGLQAKAFRHRGLYAIYSSLDHDVKYSEENFYAHEHVLETLVKNDVDILPFRFGTSIREDEMKVILESQYDVFIARIQALSGKVEMSVRGLWNYKIVLEKVKADLIVPQIAMKNELVQGYWDKKMEDFKLRESIEAYARVESERIHNLIMSDGIEGSFTLLKTDSMFFNASYLVKKTSLSDFKATYSTAVSGFPGYKFLMTGPWPPYNFCNMTI